MYSELDKAMAELMTRPRMVMVLGSGDTDLSVQVILASDWSSDANSSSDWSGQQPWAGARGPHGEELAGGQGRGAGQAAQAVSRHR